MEDKSELEQTLQVRAEPLPLLANLALCFDNADAPIWGWTVGVDREDEQWWAC